MAEPEARVYLWTQGGGVLGVRESVQVDIATGNSHFSEEKLGVRRNFEFLVRGYPRFFKNCGVLTAAAWVKCLRASSRSTYLGYASKIIRNP